MKPTRETSCIHTPSITYGGTRGTEHLSTRRKRKPDSVSSGERTEEPKPVCVRTLRLPSDCIKDSVKKARRTVLGKPAGEVRAPYAKAEQTGRIQSAAGHENPAGREDHPLG